MSKCYCCGKETSGHKVDDNRYAIDLRLWSGRQSKRKELADKRYFICTKCRVKVGKEIERIIETRKVFHSLCD